MTESPFLRLVRKLPLAIALSALAVPAAQAAKNAAVAEEQVCAPLEVIFSSSAQSTSYALNCRAGDWTLAYSGVLPRGLSTVTATYILRASNQHGASGTLTRSVAVKNPGLIAQVLRTEAVMLADGSLGVRKGKGYVSEISAGQPVGVAPVPAARGAGELTIRPFDGRGDAPRPAAEHRRDEVAASLAATKELLTRANAEVQSLQVERNGLRSQIDSLTLQLADAKAQLATAQDTIASLSKAANHQATQPVAQALPAAVIQTPTPTQVLPVREELARVEGSQLEPNDPTRPHYTPARQADKKKYGELVDTQVIKVGGRPAITIRTYN